MRRNAISRMLAIIICTAMLLDSMPYSVFAEESITLNEAETSISEM